jgi:hypothetical protein
MIRGLAALLSLSIALSAIAADRYTFHMKVTDGRTALLANPQRDQLKLSSRQLERAAKDRVLLLSDATGAHWTWLMLSWLETKPDAEHLINDRGTAKSTDADLGLIPTVHGTAKLRCYRESCLIRTTIGGRVSSILLGQDESTDIPLDSDLEISFAPRAATRATPYEFEVRGSDPRAERQAR